MSPEIYLIGLPTDSNSSFERGAAAGPAAIRAALWSDRGNMSCENGMEIGVDIVLSDKGDLTLCDTDVAADDEVIKSAVGNTAALGAVPVLLGGDHAVTFPIIAALAAQHGPIHILHFDAHPDLYDDFEGNPRSHASPFARIMEAGLAASLTQVGIRTLNRHCRDQAKRFDVNIIPMPGFAADKVPQIAGPLYISVDLDGIDPSEAPGVSHPEPGGITVRELLSILNRQIAPIIGADIVELNPARDTNEVTAILAAKLVREISSLIVRNSI
jgi:arginase